MSRLTLERCSAGVGGAAVVQDVSLSLASGELVALLGPNGAGKTSLLRAALSILPLTSGRATIDDEETERMTPMARARAVTYLPQQRPMAWPVRVADVVSLGRFAYGAAPGRLRDEDAGIVRDALRACDLEALAERRTDTLSGGEVARVHCARAFAARAPLLLADEPVAALDPRHQFTIMTLIREFVRSGVGALVVLHDIGLAARYADRLVWMRGGRIVADGPPRETLTAERLREVYGVAARVAQGEDGLVVTLQGLA